MQNNRQAQPPKGILDKKWVTYALTLFLIVLVAAFVVSLKYQDEVINFFKNLFRFGREEKPKRPTVAINIFCFDSKVEVESKLQISNWGGGVL